MLLKAVEQQQWNWDRLALLARGLTAELGNRGAVSSATGVGKFSVLLLPEHQQPLHNYSNQQHETESKEKETKARSHEKGQCV